MTPDDIRPRLITIRHHAVVGDYEAAHGEEDRLHQDVLRAIADGAEDPVGLAQGALLSTRIQFARYTA